VMIFAVDQRDIDTLVCQFLLACPFFSLINLPPFS
jgi:hypothetical protein